MDVRWSRLLVGGVLTVSVGCAAVPKQDGAELAPQPPPAAPTKPPPPPTQSHQAAAVAEPRKTTQLKPSTVLTMGALKEQAADDKNRSVTEAEQYRYQARLDYLKAIQIDPTFTNAYLALARSYTLSDERDKALATYKRATVANPKDATVWFEQGTALARWKDWPAAVDSMQQAVQLQPENKTYGKTLGLTLARAGRYEEAYLALGKVAGEAEARTSIARMLKHTQRPDESRQQLELALKANPDYAPARDLLAELTGPKVAAHQEPAPAAPAALPAAVTAQAKPVKAVTPPRVAPVLLDQPMAPIKVGFEP